MSRKSMLLSTAGAVYQSPLLTGLIAHWKLDELSGNRLSSVGSWHIVPTGTIGAFTGKLGNCITAPGGATDHLTTSDDAAILAVDWAGGFSITGWFYVPTAFGARFSLLIKNSGGNSDWQLSLFAINSLRFQVYDSVSSESTVINTTALAVDTWHFAAAQYDPADKRAAVSLNGGAWIQAAAALSNVPRNLYNRFSMVRSGTAYGVCRLDSISLWDRVITDAEALDLYNGSNGLEYPFLGGAAIEPTEAYGGPDWYVTA